MRRNRTKKPTDPYEKWTMDITEEAVLNPELAGLRCGRLELWNSDDKSDFPRREYHICLPYMLFESLTRNIRNFYK